MRSYCTHARGLTEGAKISEDGTRKLMVLITGETMRLVTTGEGTE